MQAVWVQAFEVGDMCMSDPIVIKSDKRFKPGNLKQTGGELRGNPKTMEMKPLDMPHNTLGLPFDFNPPIVVSRELGAAIKKLERGAHGCLAQHLEGKEG